MLTCINSARRGAALPRQDVWVPRPSCFPDRLAANRLSESLSLTRNTLSNDKHGTGARVEGGSTQDGRQVCVLRGADTVPLVVRANLRPHGRENVLIRFVGAGPMSAIAAFCLLTISGSAQAQTQTQPISLTATVVPTAPKTSAFTTAMATPSPFTVTTTARAVYGPSLGQVVKPGAAIVPSISPAPALTGVSGTPVLAIVPLGTQMNLAALVAANSVGEALDSEAACLATAVYFEARGESLDGQLAVAQVVMNRAVSGRYPASWCAVVKQRAQFSFVRSGGRFPAIKPACPHWARAQAIARVATKRLASALTPDVLWYHANYVAPSWGRRLNRVSQIGAHIFYRS